MSEDFMKAANDLKIKAFHPDKIKGEPSEMTTKEPKQSKKIKRLPQSDNNPAIKQEQHEGEDVDTEMLMREENGNGERMEEGGKLINATAENDKKNANDMRLYEGATALAKYYNKIYVYKEDDAYLCYPSNYL